MPWIYRNFFECLCGSTAFSRSASTASALSGSSSVLSRSITSSNLVCLPGRTSCCSLWSRRAISSFKTYSKVCVINSCLIGVNCFNYFLSFNRSDLVHRARFYDRLQRCDGIHVWILLWQNSFDKTKPEEDLGGLHRWRYIDCDLRNYGKYKKKTWRFIHTFVLIFFFNRQCRFPTLCANSHTLCVRLSIRRHWER